MQISQRLAKTGTLEAKGGGGVVGGAVLAVEEAMLAVVGGVDGEVVFMARRERDGVMA